MKKKLSEALKKKSISQFTAVSILPLDIKEKVFLKVSNNSELIDISDKHTPLCLNPLLIGVLNKNLFDTQKNNKFELRIVRYNSSEKKNQIPGINLNAKIMLDYFKSIDVENNIKVDLFRINKSTPLQSTKFQRLRYILFLYLHYLKAQKRNSISFLNNLAALYSFPRKVILNIIKTSSHFNIFPMDLVCELTEEDIIILGLNINNRSVDEIIKNKKMLIAEPISSSKDVVYGFAGNHRKEMIESDFIDKYKFESDNFHFPVPYFAFSYKEIYLIKYVQLGSHYLFICKIVNKKVLKQNEPLLFHISSLQHWHLTDQKNIYPVV
jgi:flavin reductase (DIM6/NTAB) family NADH-FMN oxidoreductase RutF